jgi:hypothetical protein
VWWLNVFKIFFQFCESGKSLLKKTLYTIFKNTFSDFFSSKMFLKFCIICDENSSGHMGRHFQHLESEGGSVWQAYLADLTHDGTTELESKGS